MYTLHGVMGVRETSTWLMYIGQAIIPAYLLILIHICVLRQGKCRRRTESRAARAGQIWSPAAKARTVTGFMGTSVYS